jgi:large subunit ribosomal protein L24
MSARTQFRIRKDDHVVVIAGRNKGKTGQVIRVYPKTQRVLVAKVNMIKRHQKPKSQTDLGGIIDKEAPLHISNVMLVDPKTKKPTRIRIQSGDKGKKFRVAVKSGEVLDKKV